MTQSYGLYAIVSMVIKGKPLVKGFIFLPSVQNIRKIPKDLGPWFESTYKKIVKGEFTCVRLWLRLAHWLAMSGQPMHEKDPHT